MATLAGVEVNDDESQIKQSLDAKDSSNSSSLKQILDPVVYKLVRVEGDGRLVPATDDEVMEVEDLLEDDKSDLPLVEDTGQEEKSKNDNHTLQDDPSDLEGGSQPENAEVKVHKLNARLEYIGVMLQKVKQEEKLRLSSGSPDHSSCQVKVDRGDSEVKVDRGCSEVKVDHGCSGSDKHDQLPTCDEKPPNDNSLQETVPALSPRLNEKSTAKPGSEETCLKSADGQKVSGSSAPADGQKVSGSSAPADGQKVSGSSAPASCSSSIPDFSLIKGDICLDNLTTKELHETFRATFGRETSVKDKLWLKRRIAMGLTNSCDVSTTTFIIKDKKLVKKKAEEAKSGIENSNTNEINGVGNISCKSLPTSPTNIMRDRQVVSGKRLRKPEAEYEYKCEDLHTEHISSKRVRKPTKRYIEELSDVDSRECNGKWVSPFKSSDPGQSYPKSHVRPVCNVGLDGTAVVTRPESLGGSGVQVPYVSRVRRGRPRENFMPLMKYHPSSMGMAAKLVKKALGVRVSRHDNENKNLRDRLPSERIEQPVIAEMEKETQDVVPCIGEQQQQAVEMENPVHQLSVEKEDLAQQLAVEMENLDSSGDNSDCNATALPTSKGGTRRKHHRAWTLSEVVKLVEGVSRYGAGRWSEIKRLAFASYAYRTSVDLKDKWRNLLRASFAQSPTDKGMKNSRKNASMPIPLPILLRVRELAEKHAQVTPALCSGNPAIYSSRGRSVYETKSGYL